MKTIILAAGMAQRLQPLTNKIPKCILKIENKSILERTIENCTKAGLCNLIFISGHGSKYLKEEINNISHKFKFAKKIIYNKFYNTMNNCYSLYLGIQNINEDIIVINSDDLFDVNIISKINNSSNTSLVVDNVKKLTPESMKIYLNNKRITDINKNLDIKKSYGESIGIARIQKEDIHNLKESLEEIINENSNLYYEDAFQKMFKKINFKVVNTDKFKWTEVDDVKDLKIAYYLVKNKLV